MMRSPSFGLSLGLAIGLSSLTGCTESTDFSTFKPGYNEQNGQRYYCEYRDSNVKQQISFASEQEQQEQAVASKRVEPGLHDTSRSEVAALAKANAVLRLRQQAGLRVIGSCELDCKSVDEDMGYYSDDSDAARGGAVNAPAPESAGGAHQASTTNNQVAGVDEADFLKNDNRYFYVASGDKVHIIDAWPAEDAHIVASIDFPDSTPSKLFLGNDRLVVYSKVTHARTMASPNPGPSGGSWAPPGASYKECTYGFDCVPTGDGSLTRISVFDIRDRSAPKLTRALDLSGSLIAARKIGDAVHSVVFDPPLAERLATLSRPPAPAQDCYDVSDDIEAATTDYRQRLDAQAALIESLDDAGPTLRDGERVIEPQFRAANIPGETFLSVFSFGLSTEAVRAETIVSRPGFVYASEQALYVSVPREEQSEDGYWYAGYANATRASEIFKFSLGADPAATRYQASGVVKGTVLNQFALDEWGGHLRVATTSGRTPDPNVHSTVSVLAQSGSTLALKGAVDNIAPTEDIRSVRFEGDRGFLVTFKKTDPLFAVDLANPSAPRVTGELKIPGYSTYMQFMDRDHLLAIGLEADEMGDFAYFQGIQLQIFDIKDMRNPRQLHKTVIGTRGTTSEALTNHLGFNYFAPKNLLALPMTKCEGSGSSSSFGSDLTFNGLLVYDVTTQTGFRALGGIEHPIGPNVHCNNWWTEAGSSVKRSVILDDFVYSVADDRIVVASLDKLDQPLVTLPLSP